MSVDPLQVTQHVEMQRARLDAVEPPFAKALQMAFGRLLLQPAHLFLHLHETPRQLRIAGRKDRLRHAQIVERDREEPRKFALPVF